MIIKMTSIDEFYNYAKYINISETGGWSSLYYGVFSKVIKENNYKNIAELGVGYGTHARYILVNNPEIENLILIDPMKFYKNDSFANDVQSKTPCFNMDNFDRMYELINFDLSQLSNKYKWIRKESSSVTDNEIPDCSLDAIFIDGDHSYKAVLNDLEKYWKKIRIGGQMLGDDYLMSDVSTAVNEFSKKYNISYDLLYKEGSDTPIFRFKK